MQPAATASVTAVHNNRRKREWGDETWPICCGELCLSENSMRKDMYGI